MLLKQKLSGKEERQACGGNRVQRTRSKIGSLKLYALKPNAIPNWHCLQIPPESFDGPHLSRTQFTQITSLLQRKWRDSLSSFRNGTKTYAFKLGMMLRDCVAWVLLFSYIFCSYFDKLISVRNACRAKLSVVMIKIVRVQRTNLECHTRLMSYENIMK